MKRIHFTVLRAALATILLVVTWGGVTLSLGRAGLVDVIGWSVFYVVGLIWVIFLVERSSQRYEAERLKLLTREGDISPSLVTICGEVRSRRQGWNPLDPASNYFGTSSQRLRQSLALLINYSIFFALLYLLAHLRFGSQASEGYDLPEGGGKDSIQASAVKVQKVVRKKFVINPYSSIVFSAPPPIDQIDVKLMEESQNRYTVGQGGVGDTGDGDGSGAGFGSGTGKGKVPFVRLKYADKGWDRNFGFGGDRNMLNEYMSRTKQKIADSTEFVDAGTLASMPATKAPSFLYISGNNSLALTATEKKHLKQYVLERHGMIFGDNHGGPGFHQNFIAVMNEITGVTPVPIARDDRIHQRPYNLPQLPIVVAHGPPVALGWKIDGRWAVYYHPGALSDAWRDDRAGIRKDVAESCYQLGVNVIFYSLSEKNKWLQSQKP